MCVCVCECAEQTQKMRIHGDTFFFFFPNALFKLDNTKFFMMLEWSQKA